MAHRIADEFNTINYQSLSIYKKKKKKVRERKGNREREREREGEKIRVPRRFEAVHALPARNGVSVIYGGHSRLELSLSENMFTPGG